MREERLESWKEISSYLNRGVRTVQRWEKLEGLPVHRHSHDRLGSVYAFRHELDAWCETRRVSLAASGLPPEEVHSAALRWGLPLAATLALAAVVAATRLVTAPIATTTAAPLSPTPVTTLPGSELFPTLSPDGSTVAFSWAQPGKPLHLYARTIGTERQRQLTRDRKSDLGACWSPDGTRIAFLRGRPMDGPQAEVIVASANGGSERAVAATERDWGPYLGWTPDSRGIVFSDCHSPRPCAIRLLWLDTGETRTLTTPKPGTPGDTSPSISPGGTELLFLRRPAILLPRFRPAARNSSFCGAPALAPPCSF